MTPPGRDEALALANARFPRRAQVLELDDGNASLLRDLAGAGFAVTGGRHGPALAAPETFDGAVCLQPTRLSALMPTIERLHHALAPEGLLVLTDLVWQTAPSPGLLQAFAPLPGREKVRPIEGYEMLVEHAGFELLDRVDADRDAWAAALAKADPAKAAALRGDDRGAARAVAWCWRKTDE